MAQTSPPAITAAPTPAPQRNDRTTFSARVDAFVTWLIAAVAQFSAVATNVYTNAVDAYNSAVAGAASAAASAASAASSAAAANVVKWVSGTTYAEGDGVWSPANYQSYRRKSAGGGTTDPSLDSTNWALIGGLPAWSVITSNPSPAVVGNRYMANTTSAAFTITLPAAPSANDRVIISDYAGTFATNNLTVGRNSLKIMGLTEDLILNMNNITLTLDYVDTTQGWRIT